MYDPANTRCHDDARMVFRIVLGNGKVRVTPVYKVKAGRIVLKPAKAGLRFFAGQPGCQTGFYVDAPYASGLPSGNDKTKPAIGPAPRKKPVAYTYSLPRPIAGGAGCPDAVAQIRSYWGYSEHRNTYLSPATKYRLNTPHLRKKRMTMGGGVKVHTYGVGECRFVITTYKPLAK